MCAMIVGTSQNGAQQKASLDNNHHSITTTHLWDDRQPATQLGQGQSADVNAINHDATRLQVEHAVECKQQGGLARTGTADHTNLLLGLHAECDALESRWQVGCVLHHNTLKADLTTARPACSDLLVLHHGHGECEDAVTLLAIGDLVLAALRVEVGGLELATLLGDVVGQECQLFCWGGGV